LDIPHQHGRNVSDSKNQKGKSMADDKVTFVRGADGTLYTLSEDTLTKLTSQQQTDVDGILNKHNQNVKTHQLSKDVVTEIQAVNGCVKVTAQAPDVYTNNKK
jgi:hypothetical protein